MLTTGIGQRDLIPNIRTTSKLNPKSISTNIPGCREAISAEYHTWRSLLPAVPSPWAAPHIAPRWMGSAWYSLYFHSWWCPANSDQIFLVEKKKATCWKTSYWPPALTSLSGYCSQQIGCRSIALGSILLDMSSVWLSPQRRPCINLYFLDELSLL